MFPFQNYNNWSFPSSDFICEEEQNQVDNQHDGTDLAPGVESMNPTIRGNRHGHGGGRGRDRGRGRGRGRRSSSSPDDVNIVNYNDNDDDETRKTIHREVERQRRQEMSSLYSSLRSILPADYMKGKRSTSDHLGEAVNYIKDLEKNVKDLTNKRDHFRDTLEWSNPTHEMGGSSNPRPCPGTVVINHCLGGLIIEIQVGYGDEGFSLSSALQVIFEEGLSVSSCTSNKCDDKMIHSIMCEMNDITCIDFIRLQQRLIDLVC